MGRVSRTQDGRNVIRFACFLEVPGDLQEEKAV